MPSSYVPPQKPVNEPEQPLSASQLFTSAPVALLKRPTSQPPWYYRLAIGVLKPIYRAQVWRRSHQRDNYQQEVAQRFGHQYPPRPLAQFEASQSKNHQLTSSQLNNIPLNNRQQVIWCHAVSLGETNTVAPLLDALLAQGYQIWLTNTTQTGFARGASRFADDIAQGRMSHSYVPVDSPAVIEKFLAHVQPIAALFVETELWANILTILSQQHIPSILVNGRLSAASFTRYQKIAAVSKSMMQNLTLIIAQDSESAKRFRQLGAHSAQIRVAGSLKWVINTPKITNSHIATDDQNAVMVEQKMAVKSLSDIGVEDFKRPVWVAASTHNGEESTALAWQQQLLASAELAKTLLIIVPRHPERFDEVANLIKESGLQLARRSSNDAISAQTQVYLADSMGELMHWYAVADVALVGGSLVDIGGHNPVEPATVSTPIVMGRYTQSCQTVVDKLAGAGALYQPNNIFYQSIGEDKQSIKTKKTGKNNHSVTNTTTSDTEDSALIYEQLQFWLSHPQVAKQAGQAGAQLAEQQQAVLTRQRTIIERVIEQSMVIKD